MKKSRITYSLIVLVAILAFTVGAKDATAVPITGTIGFGGSVTPTGGSSGNYSDVTGLSFNFAVVVSSSGSFLAEGIFPGNVALFADFDFDPLAPSPVDPLWAVGTAQFRLDTITVPQQTATYLDLAGTGLLTIFGFDDTPGNWTFSGDTVGGTFSFSSTTGAADPAVPPPNNVPEPTTMLLLGIGLVGLAGTAVRRRLKKTKKL